MSTHMPIRPGMSPHTAAFTYNTYACRHVTSVPATWPAAKLRVVLTPAGSQQGPPAERQFRDMHHILARTRGPNGELDMTLLEHAHAHTSRSTPPS